MAYREEAPTGSWSLTERPTAANAGAVATLSVLTVLGIAMSAALAYGAAVPLAVATSLATVVLAAAVVVTSNAMGAARLPGEGRELRLYQDRVIVPRSDGLESDVMALDGLRVEVVEQQVSLNLVTLARGRWLLLESGPRRRRLAASLFDDAVPLEAVRDALERAVARHRATQ